MTPFIGASSRNEPALRFEPAGARVGIAGLEGVAVEVEVKRIVLHREARALLHAGNIEADDAIVAMNDRDFDLFASERNQIIVRSDGHDADGMMGVA